VTGEPESVHRACWYSRRTPYLPSNLTVQTIEDGQLLYCGHPMYFPVVGHRFDLRNCVACEYFKPVRPGYQTVAIGRRTYPTS